MHIFTMIFIAQTRATFLNHLLKIFKNEFKKTNFFHG